MKLKPLIAITLCAVVAVGTWHVLHRSVSSPPKAAEATAPLPARRSTAADLRPRLLSAALNTVKEDPASSAIQTLVTAQSQYTERVAVIKAINSKLSPSDVATLQAFLLQPGEGDNNQLEQALKNDLLNALCNLNPPPAWLAETMIEMYRDTQQNVVIRDYAVQHLASLYEQMEIAGQDNSQTKGLIQEVLSEAVSEDDSSIAGTALLALGHLSQGRSEFDQDKIAGWASQLARNNTTSELTRIAAIQVCGQLGVRGTIAFLTQMAQSEQSIPLRIAAIGSLGVLGDSQATSLLTGLANGGDARLKIPAQHALNQIQRQERAAAKNQKS